MYIKVYRTIVCGLVIPLVLACGPNDEEIRAEFTEPYRALGEQLVALRKSVPYPGWRRNPGKLEPAPDYGFAEKPGNVIVFMYADLAELNAEPVAGGDADAKDTSAAQAADPKKETKPNPRREVARDVWGRLDHERDMESVSFMGYGSGDMGRYFGSYRQQYLQETLDAKYLLMPRVRAYRKPKAMDTENFRGGRLIVDVYLADLEQKRWLGGFTVNVENGYYVSYTYRENDIDVEKIDAFQRALEYDLVSKFPGAIKDQLVKKWGFAAPPKPVEPGEANDSK